MLKRAFELQSATAHVAQILSKKPDRRIATDSGAGLLDLLLVHQNTACEDQRLRSLA